MRWIRRIVTAALSVVVLGTAGLLLWLWVAPPELLRVGSGYAAKIVCSNVFLAGRDADEVLSVDVQAPGNPLLRLMRVTVDQQRGRVHAALLGFIAGNDAVYSDGFGCAVRPNGVAADAAPTPPVLAAVTSAEAGVDESLMWPDGGKTESREEVVRIISDPALAGPGMRAIVVVKGGRIVAETYAPGFSKATPMLGWSMTKTVTAALIGRLVEEGRMSLDAADLMPSWRNDRRREVTIRQLLAMESGLEFNEGYGSVADATQMLYLENDMAAFAESKPLAGNPGTIFNYSSGTGVLLSKILMQTAGGGEAALGYPGEALFEPLGMRSAVLETDAAGTFVGSSYMYATARDWGRFGLFLAHDGVWKGQRLLPEGFVQMMQQPGDHSNGRYSKMQTWLPRAGIDGIAPDTFYIQGHDGQTIAVMPSQDLVVVRLGLTPSTTRYVPGLLVGAVAKATGVTP